MISLKYQVDETSDLYKGVEVNETLGPLLLLL